MVTHATKNAQLAASIARDDAARLLIDVIANPQGRDFMYAWSEATLMFGRVGNQPTLIDACLNTLDKVRRIIGIRWQVRYDDGTYSVATTLRSARTIRKLNLRKATIWRITTRRRSALL